jgi:hypothetical protein
VCNLYSMRLSREEVIGLFNISRVGNDVQLDLPSIYPNRHSTEYQARQPRCPRSHDDALGVSATPEGWSKAGDQCSQHEVLLLADLAEKQSSAASSRPHQQLAKQPEMMEHFMRTPGRRREIEMTRQA